MMKYQNGSIRRSADNWEFRYRDANRKQCQKSLPVSKYPTETAARIAMSTLIYSLNRGVPSGTRATFGQLAERFISEGRLREIVAQPKGVVKPDEEYSWSSAKNYLCLLRVHLLPRWSDVAIEAIEPGDVLLWLKGLTHLSGMSRGGLKALMHLLFEKAMLWKMIEIGRNPIQLVKLRGTSIRKKKKVILSIEQFQELRAVLPEPYKAMITLALCTGLRISEITALRWEHVINGRLAVQASSSHGRIGRVKTQASGDMIPLPSYALEGLTPCVEGLIFPGFEGGTLIGGNIVTNVLKPAGRKLWGIDIGWHTFRHTYRSLLDETGAPVGVQQKLMRHASIVTTMNIYGDAAMRLKEQTNSKVVQMVIGRTA